MSIALFTADLRLYDNPVLTAALRSAPRVVPLFVVDSGIAAAGFAVPNRAAFLADCLAALDEGLRARGGRLVVRSGEVVAETSRLAAATGAGEVHIAAGVSGYALRREERLRSALAADGRLLRVHDAVVTAVPPGAVLPAGKDHYAVFTPYFRRWSAEPLRPVLPAPRAVRLPEADSEPLPAAAALARGTASPGLPRGGEGEGRRRLAAWRRGGLAHYADRHDDLARDATSRLSPHLPFGSLSPVELVASARERAAAGCAGATAFVRQLAWRDFHHQMLAARPQAAHRDYRPRHDRRRRAPGELAAWRSGLTGYPLVDAAMRQLAHEGWMHNRARLIAASFLTKTLYLDWRDGARHFLDLLVDGDVADNQLNWQWVAGTGSDTRPHRVLNPLVQADRFDPGGAYVRRWVPELAAVPGRAVHRPWRLPARERARLDYPEPVVSLEEGLTRFRQARGLT
ncbi:deoxyribodipyrimidine photo-lyase [Streptomyces rectiverticillatus]|uniref:cryptochrome/photolyase family protein n=1 Tax=Streptomyces rectiverticillatus TaxID=173860 RepID=UPI0015C366C2|nr:deoxyribodipyrimidine photo-lyase [Streptomyces rectiverticillatus]QLE74695.1 deoxyribodipyrimidine photo-lyase [Streptomyces rectiverticillatus]